MTSARLDLRRYKRDSWIACRTENDLRHCTARVDRLPPLTDRSCGPGGTPAPTLLPPPASHIRAGRSRNCLRALA